MIVSKTQISGSQNWSKRPTKPQKKQNQAGSHITPDSSQIGKLDNIAQKIKKHFTPKIRSTQEEPKIRNSTRHTDKGSTISQRVK